ncbi:MAG: hypothetical protein ACE5F1_15160 [Planctomycetota bacterium]
MTQSRLLPLAFALPCFWMGCTETRKSDQVAKGAPPAKGLSQADLETPEVRTEASPTKLGKRLQGSYRVNLEAYAKEWLRMAENDLPRNRDEQDKEATTESKAIQEVKDFRMELELHADQTFMHRTKAARHAPETVVEGTWTLAGDQISFVTERFNGEAVKDAEPYSGTYSKGRIVLASEDGPSYVLDLR